MNVWPHGIPDAEPEDDDDESSGWLSEAPDVTETENPVVATLFGPDGDVLVEIHERRIVPFGYRRAS